MVVRTRKLLLNSLIAVLIAFACIPAAMICVDRFFGLGSLLLVPAIAIGVWFTVTARDRRRRAWWFGYSVSVGVCFPLCAYVERGVLSIGRYLQDLSQSGVISLSQRVLEPALLILIVVCPLIAASVLGLIAGRLCRRFTGAPRLTEPPKPGTQMQWRLSVRELLIGFAAMCLLLGWIIGHVRSRNTTERENLSAFLVRFESSFTSGEVTLLDDPQPYELQRTLIPESGYRQFQGPGVNEYRFVAPIEKHGERLWAVWAYTCNGEQDDFIYQFGYAEASHMSRLPQFPLPARRYVEGTWYMVDGIPSTAGPSATVVSATPPPSRIWPAQLTATAPPGTECELVVYPLNAVVGELPPKKPDNKGLVHWSWKVTASPSAAGTYNYSRENVNNCIEIGPGLRLWFACRVVKLSAKS